MKIVYMFNIDRGMYQELSDIPRFIHRASSPEDLGKLYGNVYKRFIDLPDASKYMQRETNEIASYYTNRLKYIRQSFQKWIYPFLVHPPKNSSDIAFISYNEPGGSGKTKIEFQIYYRDQDDGLQMIEITDDNISDHFNFTKVLRQDRAESYGEAEEKSHTILKDDYYFQYNVFDGSKKYVELENYHDKGSCRNFTFQVTEDCNLRCFAAGTKVLMADFTEKNIEDIQLNDVVMGFDEFDPDAIHDLYPVKVTNVFKQSGTTIELCINGNVTRVTPNHEYITSSNEWVEIGDLSDQDGLLQLNSNYELEKTFDWRVDASDPIQMVVYNLETESHTYIANSAGCHNCSYCYQINKCKSILDLETAKIAVDDLLMGNLNYLSPGFSKSVILEFIGGDPLLEIDLIGDIYQYFLEEAYRLNHPWFYHHRLSMCTNAMLYFSTPTKKFFDKYSRSVSFNVSIDGNKALHDSCRIQPTGEGSYDIGIAAVHHSADVYRMDISSKMTLAPSNIPMISESVKNLCFDNNYPGINLNCVFEDVWSAHDATVLFHQLKQVADMVINKRRIDLYFSIFRHPPFHNNDIDPSETLTSTCGGVQAMMSLGPDKNYYPCIRFMPSSLGDDVNAIVFGDTKDKLKQNNPLLREMAMVSYQSQCNDKCLSCAFMDYCGQCSGLCYQYYGTPNEKTRSLCDMARAEYLASVYYWCKMKLIVPEFVDNIDDNIAPYYHFRDIITLDEYNEVKGIWLEAKSHR